MAKIKKYKIEEVPEIKNKKNNLRSNKYPSKRNRRLY